MTNLNMPKINYHKRILIVLLVLTFARITGLVLSPLNLHGDEAQYWAWSRNFDWGYFSKPPMIAWLIGATTSIFGNSEWAIRLSTPIIHPLTAYVIFRTGKFLYEERSGFWAACFYFLMPAVWLSSGIVSTDVSLLLFWAIGMNALMHLRTEPTYKWALLLGAAIGFGMLSKYAMLFFLIALFICVIIDAKTRKALLSKNGLIIAAISLAILSPNLYWNAANNFATIGHTAANANLGGSIFHPKELLEFVLSQFGVFGPLSMGLLLLACFTALRKKIGQNTLLLCVFVLTPLLIISFEALLSRANANWAVSAYISGSILAARFGLQTYDKFTKAGIWTNVALGSLITAAGLMPNFANTIGAANAVKRMRGWPETESLITAAALRGHDGKAFSAIAADNRLVFYDLLYYGIEKDSGLPLRMWLRTSIIHHHAEANAPLLPSRAQDAPVLIVNHYGSYDKDLRDDFERLEKLPPLTIKLGGGKSRTLHLWAGYGYTPTQVLER